MDIWVEINLLTKSNLDALEKQPNSTLLYWIYKKNKHFYLK